MELGPKGICGSGPIALALSTMQTFQRLGGECGYRSEGYIGDYRDFRDKIGSI